MTAQPVTPAPARSATRELPAPRPAPFGRRTAVVALTVGAALNLAEALVWRVVGQSGSIPDDLAAVADRPTLAAVALAVGTIGIPFLLLGLVAMAQLVRPHMPRLGTTAMVLGFVGVLGFAGMHAVSIYDIAAAEQPDRAAMVALVEDAQGSALALLVLVPFLLGMAGSVLLSSIGYLRTRVVPIWIPMAFLVFLVLDFGGLPTGPVDPHWLFVAASLGLAVTVARRTDEQWWTGRADGDADR
ncbi:hypothetical protein SAMN05660662_0944 [Blastococcus aurantiacus]|uniref:DUF4386 family protein n=1 Tax=Blastococcus aurantiacus TaxID=1550231 RepID=A0A1G7I1H5_9ACTN|nr:hypothetical protein [Blastococcus aurantiacus]SDF06423.1 hypothetical protein SAMN05660662_0944 [Blastococcus aurantiacus]